MRTTLTLDADVSRTLKAEVRSRKVSLKTVVNEALRAGLGLANPRRARVPFRVKPHAGGLAPGLDPSKLNQLAAELADEAVLGKSSRR